MVTDLFGTLLQELGKALSVELRPDEHNSCLIRFRGGLEIQIELDQQGQALLVGTDLGVVPPGRYRENLFTEALKANGMPPPRHGIFAYSRQSDHLVLFEKFSLVNLTGDKVADFLTPFMEKAKGWKEAISKNEVPVVSTTFTSHAPTGMFGLRP